MKTPATARLRDGLNPFNYRAGTEHFGADMNRERSVGLNPFNYRAGTERGTRRGDGRGLPVSIPSTTGLVLNHDA